MGPGMNMFNIEKLEEDNYDGWKIHMKSVLIQQDLWGYVNGTILKPSEMPEEENWEMKDQKALSTILLCVKRSQLNVVKHCSTSRNAWIELEKKFQPQGPGRKVLLFRRLVSMKMMSGTSMTSHLSSLEEIVEKLIEVDINIPEELLSIMLLNSLSDEVLWLQ